MIGWIRRVLLAASLVGLTACGPGRVSPMPAQSPPLLPVPSAPAVPVAATTASAPPPAPSATPARTCRAADLAATAQDRVSHPPRVDTRWAWAVNIRLTSHARTACTLTGWPELTMVGVDLICVDGWSGKPDCPADHTARREQKVTRFDLDPPTVYAVKPGEYVAFSVLWSQMLDPVGCPTGMYLDPYEADIRVPGDQSPVVLRPVPIQPCNGDVGITALGVLV
ncbi:hypothetical protein AB0M46_37080 [Dactylosporangium sp. NPDC051485]|uniref:hypothetical protein n=1 Tax=Dactylosporangium sp. NPDC051485 TaxID=3154846 RepID=UPI003447B3C7